MKIQIVNNDDELIGVKERSIVDYQNDIYRVSSLWLTNPKGQALLAKRSFKKDKDPGMWGPAVAGTLDENETYESNIHKEIFEEIGLTGLKLTLGPKVRRANPRNYFCQWFLASVDKQIDEFTRQKSEVDELAWVDIDWLKRDLLDNPEKYIPTMPHTILDLNL